MESPLKEFRVNDFVFGKMSGFPPWPAIVMAADPAAPPRPKDSKWVYFFGEHNYAWIEDKHIKPFEEYKEQYKATYKQTKFKKALEELESIIENMHKDPDYRINFVKYISKEHRSTPKESKSTPKKIRKSSGLNSTPVPKKKARTSSMLNEDTNDNDSILSSLPLVDKVPKTLNTSNVTTSEKVIGFWAGNLYAGGIIKNLINSGHQLNIWSHSSTLCEELEEYAEQQRTYLKTFNSPAEVVRNSDIIFSCLADPDKPKELILEMGDLLSGKGYVEMTSLDPERSKDLSELISNSEGRYLEAMIQGCREESMKGELVVLTAGAEELFLQCQSSFKAMAKATFLLGDSKNLGAACKAHLILQVMRGIFLTGFTEGFAMADKCGIILKSFHNVFSYTDLSSSYLEGKAEMILSKNFASAEEPLSQLQKDLALGLEMSNKYRQPMPLASNANEILKHARRLGCDNQDACCIYNRTRY
ncbi:cytokine-like nuclear factor N-PAC [Rhynchophorus ferrugineus]|uniref:Cytokine-like nuclear factor N-PAC n=1 Tax=Rhynchophorus ferrugineus TaxID=354439 RepID=A0A834M2R0_RHYFE|nr:hypothetical protein GWI33_018293 [Rhynchophorus ferrugineus]